MKKCFKCGAEKSILEFYKHPGMKDRHLGKCKECTKNDTNRNRKDNLEYYQAYDRKRNNLPHRIEIRKNVARKWTEDGRKDEAQKRYRNRYPERYHALIMLGNAVRGGRILKPNRCSKCGIEARLEGHHNDYNKPLDVQWLCNSCHVDTRRKYAKLEY